MKSYPSIIKTFPWAPPDEYLYTFDKVDGSNLRFEYTRKRGWYKFGTRHRLFDKSDPEFGVAIDMFQKTHAEPLAKIAYDNKWDPFVAFCEFHGEHSFAGLHDPNDVKYLSLIDVSVHRIGILDPRDYLNIIDKVPSAKYLGNIKWNNQFLERVRAGQVEDISLEGVVGKRQEGARLFMYKAKTEMWLDLVAERYSPIAAEKIINS